MNQIGEVFVKLNLDDSEFDKGLSNVQNKTEKTGGFLSNAFAFATGGLIAKGIETIGSSIGNVASSMISGNAQFEKYQTQFGVLLGSTDEAKKRLAELAKFGATTPFELPELVDADKVLTGFGIHSQDMLNIVGDVSAGTGVAFKDMALLMGKFSAGATGEVISRFAELGITNRRQLAEMGLQFSKSGELLSPLPDAMAVVEQIMKDKFGGMMQAQSMTFEGMVSNLQDWAGQTIRTLGAPIFDVVKDKLGVLLAFLNDPATMASLNAFATSLATGIGVAMDFIANQAIPALITGWTNIQPALTIAMNIFNTLANIITTNVIPALITIANFIASNIKPILAGLVAVLLIVVVPAFIAWSTAAIAAATATIAALAPVLIPLAAIGLSVGLLFKAWDSNFLGIRDSITGFWNNTGLPIFNLLKTWLSVNIPIAIQTLTGFWLNTLKPALDTIWNFISNTLIPIIVELAVGTFNTLNGAVQTVAGFWNNTLKPAFDAVYSFLNTWVIPIIVALADVHLALLQKASKSLSDFWTNTLKPAFDAVGKFINDTIVPILTALANTHLEAVRSTSKSLSDFWTNTLKPAFSAIGNFIKTILSPTFETLKGNIDAVGNAISAIGGFVSDAIGWLHKLADAIRGTPKMPSGGSVPGFASGTNFAPGGLAMVGERGPELINLPRGAQVIPNSQIASTNINITYQTMQSSGSVATDVGLLQAMYATG